AHPRVVAAALLLLTGCSAGPPAPREVPSKPADLKLTIRAKKVAYGLDEARDGNVTVLARFENSGSQTVLLAHPNVGFPREMKDGETLVREADRGAISILIERPKGHEVHLRNNILRLFQPENQDHLLIPPGQAREILLGWLGPYFSLGQWADLEEPIFTSSGDYQITVRYWNDWPVAYIAGKSGKPSAVNPWTGALESNTITLRVE
ncbi:MAG: hypothetical protein ACYTEY_12725, partial [Planctomycetota bacterium]